MVATLTHSDAVLLVLMGHFYGISEIYVIIAMVGHNYAKEKRFEHKERERAKQTPP